MRYQLTSPSHLVSWVNAELVRGVFVCVCGGGGGGGTESINKGPLMKSQRAAQKGKPRKET